MTRRRTSVYANDDLREEFAAFAADRFPDSAPARVAQSLFLVCWCRETAHPQDAPAWTVANPTIGQADVTSMAVQNLLDGTIVEMHLGCGRVHYFNRYPDGTGKIHLADLVRPELPEARPNSRATTFRAMLTGFRSANVARGERYDLLKKLLRERIRNPA